LLWTLRLAEIHNAPLHSDIRERAQAAFDFMRPWVDSASGLAPNYGSNDGSLTFPLAPGAYRDFRPLLQLGAAVLHRSALKPGPWDEAALWFGAMPPAVEKAAPVPVPTAETGYFRLGDENSWALVRAGRYTRRPFQADQLHVDLWWQGINLARDAGTYLYNGPAPWNNGLAGTAVHNTATVDHHDQMRRASRFLWVDWAQASGRSHSSARQACHDRFEGEHDGYRRFGVTHRRIVQWLGGAGWIIVDDMEGAGEHDVRLHWLVADLPFEVSNSPFQVVFPSGQSRVRWNIFGGSAGNGAIIRAGVRVGGDSAVEHAQLLGWESPTYGDLQPAISLVYQTRSQLPARFVTVVLTDERYKLESGQGQLIILRDESEVNRVSLSAGGTHNAESEPSAVSMSRA
jgi:Heparinase II/III-like protein